MTMFEPIAGERQCRACLQCLPLSEFGKPSHTCASCYRKVRRDRYRLLTGTPGHWHPTDAELAAIRRHYPTGGPAACMPYMGEGVTPSKVKRAARQQGVRCIPGATHPWSDNAPWAIPAQDDAEKAECVRLRNWRYPVAAGQLVPTIGRVAA